MDVTQRLFENNERWAANLKQTDPQFFARLVNQQQPEFLWIGCSDSRVPANDVVGLKPGELFVHRNVANVVSHSDMNCLSVIQFAVEVLKVKHIIVCGHYGCSGVRCALENREMGLIDNWLMTIKDIYERNRSRLVDLPEEEQLDRLCEYNVMRQAANVCYTSFVQDAWRAGRELSVHGWIYSIRDGILRDLGLCIDGLDQLSPVYRFAPEPCARRA